MAEKKKVKKNKKEVVVNFLGISSQEVTNSMYLVEFGSYKILLDCGLYQSANMFKNYKHNSRNLGLKYSEINFIILTHLHADHVGLLPRLYKNGCKAKIFIANGTKNLLELMLRDTCKIIKHDCDMMIKYSKGEGKFFPIFDEIDVDTMLDYIVEVDDETQELTKSISFKFYNAGHIIKSKQIYMEFKVDKNTTKRLGYTGDIGSTIEDKFFTMPFEPMPYCDLLISETTYGGNSVGRTKKLRFNELKMIENAIRNTKKTQRTLIGAFSLERLQNIMLDLYEIFRNDESFKTKILIDAPLGHRISNIIHRAIDERDIKKQEKFQTYKKMMEWENIKWLDDYNESKYYKTAKEPLIILSTSNMLDNGRILEWVQSMLPDRNNTIIFCGYTTEDSLATRIKDKSNAQVFIDKKFYVNECKLIDLQSYSSHITRSELLNLHGLNANYDRLVLVHGELENKRVFARMLKKELNRLNKTNRIILPEFMDSIII